MGKPDELANRRPLKSRGSAWARFVTEMLLRSRISPNQISTLGIIFSAIGGWAVLAAGERPWLYLVAAACVQLRLLCNLFDGLVAIEGGRKSAYGALYNEVPDRIEDSILLICFGFAAGLGWLGLAAALLAAITAYIRTLGGVLGFAQDFGGPMAKQHRMAALTLGALGALIESMAFATDDRALTLALVVIAAGAAATIVRRTLRIARQLKAAQ